MISLDLNEKQLFEYIRCPAYYDFINNKKFIVKEDLKIRALLNKVAMSFYLNLMNGKVLSTNQLKKKWDAVCEQNQDTMTSQKCLEGMGQLVKLFRWTSNEELLIADVNMPYEFSIKKDDIHINFRGEIPVILIHLEKLPIY